MTVEYVPEFMRQSHPGTSAGIVCPYRKSKLPAGAVKCANCGEWLSKESKPKSMFIYCLLGIILAPSALLGLHLFYAQKYVLWLIQLAMPIFCFLGAWACCAIFQIKSDGTYILYASIFAYIAYYIYALLAGADAVRNPARN